MNRLILVTLIYILFSCTQLFADSKDIEIKKLQVEVLDLKRNISELDDLGNDIDFYSILITVIVLILALKTSNEAKSEAKNVVNAEISLLKKEYKNALDEFKKKSDIALESFQEEGDFDSLLGNFSSFQDEIDKIKIKSKKEYTFNDMFMMGLFYYKKNEYMYAEEFFRQALEIKDLNLFQKYKTYIFLEKSLSFQNLNVVKEETLYYDKIIFSSNSNNKLDNNVLKLVYQAYIFKIGRLMILNKNKEALEYLDKLLFSYDLTISYYIRIIYMKLLIHSKHDFRTDFSKKIAIRELKLLKYTKDDKFKDTVLTRLETSFRYSQNVCIDIDIIKKVFTSNNMYKDLYLNAVADMFLIFNQLKTTENITEIEKEYERWRIKYKSLKSFNYNFVNMGKWVNLLDDNKLREQYLILFCKFSKNFFNE